MLKVSYTYVKISEKIYTYIQKIYILYAQCLKILYHEIIYLNIIFCPNVWAGTYILIINAVYIAQRGIIRALVGQRTTTGVSF